MIFIYDLSLVINNLIGLSQRPGMQFMSTVPENFMRIIHLQISNLLMDHLL